MSQKLQTLAVKHAGREEFPVRCNGGYTRLRRVDEVAVVRLDWTPGRPQATVFLRLRVKEGIFDCHHGVEFRRVAVDVAPQTVTSFDKVQEHELTRTKQDG